MSTTIVRDPYFFTYGADATSERLNNHPLGFIGYSDNQGVSQAAVTSGSWAISNCSVTAPNIQANRMIKITATTSIAVASPSSLIYELRVLQGATQIGVYGLVSPTADGQSIQSTGFVPVKFATAASNVVFSLQLHVTSGSGTLTVDYVSPNHAYILVEDIGAAS